MIKIIANNGNENYAVELQSQTANIVIADEPHEKGGRDKGFSPKELLASSLAACTSATVRMYCSHKEWDLTNIFVQVEVIEKEGKTVFNRKLQFEGNLDELQRIRLLKVANACPVHKILTQANPVDTELI